MRKYGYPKIKRDPDFEFIFQRLEQEPNDFIAWSSSLMSDGKLGVFCIGNVLGTINYFKSLIITDRFNAAFGFGWNYFDAVGGYLDALNLYFIAQKATRHKLAKYTLSAATVLSSTQLTVGTTLSLLATKGVLVGGAATVSAPLGAITFAVCMGVSLGVESYRLFQAVKKTSPAYLLQDRVIKYHRIDQRIKQIEKDLNKLGKLNVSTDKIINLSMSEVRKNIKKLTAEKGLLLEKRDRLKHQALAIARCRFRNAWGRLKESVWKESLDIPELKHCDLLDELKNCGNPASIDWETVLLLEEKQKEKVVTHAFGVGVWTLAFVGMSLIAAGVFVPPLLLPGLIIASVAGGLKLTQIFQADKKLFGLIFNKQFDSENNFITNNYARYKKRQEISQQFTEQDLKHIPKIHHGKNLDHDTRTKLHLAFLLSKQKPRQKSQFITALLSREPAQRSKILEGAMNQYIDQDVLKKLKKSNLASRISSNDCQKIISDQLRKQYCLFGKGSSAANLSSGKKFSLSMS